MTAESTAVTEDTMSTLLRHAQTGVPQDRIQARMATYAELIAISRAVRYEDLGETPPATAFAAGWE